MKCKTCFYTEIWSPPDDDDEGSKVYYCVNPCVHEGNIGDDGASVGDPCDEETTFQVGPNFGCVLWTGKECEN